LNADLERTVSAILAAPPMTEEADTPAAIRELGAIRSATARVLEDETATRATKSALIRRLFKAAEAAVLPAWARAAVRREIDYYFGRELRPHVPTTVSTARRLRRAGYEKCPVCMHHVLSEIECKAFEEADRAWLTREAAHDSAVGRST
jgi:hypothetical protein